MKKLAAVTLILLAINVFCQPPKRASLVLVGDIYSGESYSNMGPGYKPTPESLRKSISRISPLLANADHMVGNLECAVPGDITVPVSPEKKLIHGADLQLLQLLRDNRLTNLSLANNHAMDYGRAGLTNTLSELKRSGFNTFGAGQNEESAATPLVLTCGSGKRRKTVVLAAGFDYQKSYHSTFDVYAKDQKSGTNLWTPERVAKQLRSLRSKFPDAVIIAFPHWGSNYEWRTKEQRQLAQAMINAGASIVIGHGAHMLQEIEYYKGKPIVYSLGNFFFLSPGRYDKKKVPPISFVCRLDLTSDSPGIRLYPINTNNLSVGYQPRPATTDEVKRLKALMSQRCPESFKLARFSSDDAGHFVSLPLSNVE